MEVNNLKAVFVDLDNTLLDFDEYIRRTMTQGFEKFGYKPYEPWMFDVFVTENNSLWHQIEDGSLTFGELQKIRWNNIFQKLGITGDGPAFELYFRKSMWESAIPVEGAYDFLRAMQGRYILCAASNGPEKQQVHRMEKGDMARYFTHLFVSEGLGAAKPSEVFFERAFAILNEGRNEPILPEETLMIGDSLTSDMAGAAAYGMRNVLFDRKREHLDIAASGQAQVKGKTLPVEAVVHSFQEAIQLLLPQ